MQFTTLYRVPRKNLIAFEPDQDALSAFPVLEIDGVSGIFWTVLAAKLDLPKLAASKPLHFDEENGLAIFEWNADFVEAIRKIDPAAVRLAAETIAKEEDYSAEVVSEAVGMLLPFLAETNSRTSAIVDYSTF